MYNTINKDRGYQMENNQITSEYLSNRILRFGDTLDYASVVFKNNDCLKYSDTDISVYRAVVDASKGHEDDIAIIFMNTSITYKALIDQADKVSDILTSFNIRKGDMVLLGANSPQAVSILLACSKIGVGAMILTERTTPEQFANTISNIDIPFMFCTSNIYASFSENNAVDELAHIVILPFDKSIGKDTSDKEYSEQISNVCTWDSFLNYKIIEKAEEIKGGYFPLTISASTGSTGAPKGIVIENRCFIALEKIIRKAGFDWKRGDIISSTLSTGVVTGTSLLLLVPLMMGLTIVQHPRYANKNPFISFLDDSSFHKATILFSPPSLWMAMIASHKDNVDLSNVRHAYTIGEPVSDSEYKIINDFLKNNKVKDRLRNMYGMSEVNSIATYSPENLSDFTLAGVALPYSDIAIFDHDSLQELPFGDPGEVFICIPTVMREYLYNPKATKEFFVKDEYGKKWVRTGDLGTMNRNGELTILGRISNRFKTPDGNYIYPYMIEKILLKLKEISRVKMTNIEYEGKMVYALHVIPSDLSLDKKELAEKVFNVISERKEINYLPRLIKIRDSFPKNQGGKVDMNQLSQEEDGFFEFLDVKE